MTKYERNNEPPFVSDKQLLITARGAAIIAKGLATNKVVSFEGKKWKVQGITEQNRLALDYPQGYAGYRFADPRSVQAVQ